MNPLTWIEDELARLAEADLLRERGTPLPRAGSVIDLGDRTLVNFASNDYLGLAGDPRLAAAAREAIRSEGVGRGASPLVCGRSEIHAELERRLAAFEGTEAALLFSSGFAANAGTIPALADRGDAIFADEKNHASLIDGCRLSRSTTHVYRHGDVEALEDLLEQTANMRRRLIVTDSVFSMDGDVAPLAAIAELAQQHGAMLLVDEAHATGVFGARGRGACEAAGVEGDAVIRVGTLSKAFGAAGGFVSGSESLIHWLANRARSYVFSTAQPSSTAAAAIAAIEVVENESEPRARLLDAAAWLRSVLTRRGWNVGASASQIIPLVVGEPGKAVALSAALRERGYWVPAIRPPSVPPGESLLRLSLTTAHTPELLSGLLAALDEVARQRDAAG